jgi:hypothetical protein
MNVPTKTNGHDKVTMHSKLMDCPACSAPIMGGFSGELEIHAGENGLWVADIPTITGVVVRHDCRKGPK